MLSSTILMPQSQGVQSSGADGTTSAAVMYNMIRGSFCPDELAAAGSMNSMLGNVTGRDYPLRFAYDKDGSLIVTGEYGSAKVVGKELGCQSVVLLTDVPLIPPLEARGTAVVATLPTLPIRHLSCKRPSYQKVTNETAAGPLLPSPPPSNGATDSSQSSNNNALAIGLGVGLSCAAIVGAVLALLTLRHRRRRNSDDSKITDNSLDPEVGGKIVGSLGKNSPTLDAMAKLTPSITPSTSNDSPTDTWDPDWSRVPVLNLFDSLEAFRAGSGVSDALSHFTARVDSSSGRSTLRLGLAPSTGGTRSSLLSESSSLRLAAGANGSVHPTGSDSGKPWDKSSATTSSRLQPPMPKSKRTGDPASQLSRLASTKSSSNSWEVDAHDVDIAVDSSGQPVVLGRGSFGAVYAGSLRGVQPSAIKVLNASVGSDADVAFQREAAILKHINRDRNVVQLYGTCKMPDGRLLLLTELMEGGDLRGALDDPQKQELLAWHRNGKSVALDIARGLTAMHAVNVIHRDLKSKNVLLSKDFSAKIGDVGIAAVHSKGYLTVSAGQVVGTLAWSAPELLMNSRCTEKVDIYSFGVCLWELATQNIPRRGFIAPPEPSEACPAELIALINDCLSYEPQERPSAKEAYERIFRIAPVS